MSAGFHGDCDGGATAAGDMVLVQRIGQLTRMLRTSMRELGLDRQVERVAEAIPDTRARLAYVATLTERAAERSLDAIDRAQPLLGELSTAAGALDERWQRCGDAPPDGALLRQTREYLGGVEPLVCGVKAQLLEVVMAQDFQDLTGQVIKRMIEVIGQVEHQLLQLLLETVSCEEERESMMRRLERSAATALAPGSGLLNGPQIDASAPEVVGSQDQVDDLLDELGF